MIFALFDYVQYRLRTGPYGDHQRDGGMGALAFLNGIPENIVAEIQPADIIFTQRSDSVFSWGTMYFGSSPVDHMAMCTGSGTVIHATLGGVKESSLKALAKNARVLIVKDFQGVVHDMIYNPAGGQLRPRAWWLPGLSPRISLIGTALEITLGFFPASFRWWFFADVVLACALIDVGIHWVWHIYVAVPVALLFGCVIAVNLSIFACRKLRNKPYRLLSHPKLGYESFFRNGGRMLTKLGPLVVCNVGIIPLQLYEAFVRELDSGQGPDHGSNDDLKELDKSGSDSAEDGYSIGVISRSEDQQGDKDNEK